MPFCVSLRSGSLSQVIATHSSLRNNWLIRGVCLGAVVHFNSTREAMVEESILFYGEISFVCVQPQAAYKAKDGFAQENSEMGQTFAWILFNKHFAALPFLLLRPVSPGNGSA